MNQITDPDKLSHKQAGNKLSALAPIVLIIDLVAAAGIWFFQDHIFNQEAAYLAGMISAALLIAGLFSFFILRLMGKRMTRAEK